MNLFQRFERNTEGRDFVVGDVHGCFNRLQTALDRANFQPSRDRLFSVGDLVDRGTQSHEVADWLDKPWFHAVRGNHEQMAIEANHGVIDQGLHCVNGGLWFYVLEAPERERICAALERLPYAIEIDTPDGLIGVIHAEVPGDDWDALRTALTTTELPPNFEHYERFLLWGRDLIRGRSPFDGVTGVDRVYVGHTPVRDWHVLQNVHYIDTGACFGKALTLACISDGNVLQVAP